MLNFLFVFILSNRMSLLFKNPIVFRFLNYGRTTENFHSHSHTPPDFYQVVLVARGQRQIMHQLDSLSNLLHEYFGERARLGRANQTSRMPDADFTIPLVLTLAIGAVGVFLFKGLTSHK